MMGLINTAALLACAYGLYACLRRLDILEQRLDLMERRERLREDERAKAPGSIRRPAD